MTDCFMSAFIGLCRALSHSPRWCVPVCARHYAVCVQERKPKWYCMAIIAGMFGDKSFLCRLGTYFTEPATGQFVSSLFTSKVAKSVSHLNKKVNLKNLKHLFYAYV